jgi:hypothetical protein
MTLVTISVRILLSYDLELRRAPPVVVIAAV